MSDHAKKTKPRLLIRADGSVHLGHGHIFRTLVLAGELRRRGYEVAFLCRQLEGAPLSRISQQGFFTILLDRNLTEQQDCEQTINHAKTYSADWVIVDRYATDEISFSSLWNHGFKILAIDDLCAHPFPVDILVNQNSDAEKLNYLTNDSTIKLFGPHYALIRKIYLEHRPKTARVINEIGRVLVFMGGSDPVDATSKVLESLNLVKRKRLVVDLVIGAANPHDKKVVQLAESLRYKVCIHKDLTDLVSVMKTADLAIVAGGSVTWELCCIGVPMLFLTIADNQEGISLSMDRIGAGIYLGRINQTDHKTIVEKLIEIVENPRIATSLSTQAWNLVDGLGASRIAQAFEGY